MSERFQRSRYPLSERLIQGAGSRLARSGGGGFSYNQLSETYPTLDVRRATAPRYVQEELDERDLILKEREAIAARRRADLQILDTQINQQRAMYDQIPMARQALAELNPADDNFLNQLITQQANNPLAYENPDFQQTVVNPLIRRHEMLQQNKMIIQRGQKPEETREITEEAFQKAAGLLSDPAFQKQVQAGDQIALGRAAVARETYNQFMQQQGIVAAPQQETGMEMEMDTGMEEVDPDVLQARRILSRRPELRDEINRRLISAGKPPIE